MKTNYSNTSMLDMLFENRNQAYGAYVLRRDANQAIGRAMLVTFSSVFLLLSGNFLTEKLKAKTVAHIQPHVIIETKNICTLPTPPPKPEQKIAEQKIKAKAIPTVANVEKRIVAENKAPVDSIPSTEDLSKYESGQTTNLTAETGKGATDGTGSDKTFEVAKAKETVATNEIHDWSEDMPEFPGGEKKLQEFLAINTVFPAMERELGMQGKAFIRFVVNEDGSVSDAQVVKADSKNFSRAALNVIAMLPKFKPGRQGGKPVKVRYTLPFMFRLN